MRALGATGVGHLVMSGHSRECERMRASISAALDRELSEPESIRVREHVAHCPSCRAFQADTKRLVSTLRAAPLEPKAPGDRSACHLPLSRDQVDKIAAVGKKAAGLEGPQPRSLAPGRTSRARASALGRGLHQLPTGGIR